MNFKQVHNIFDISVIDENVFFENTNLTVESKSLSKYLTNCSKAIIIAATLGIEADQTIEKLQNEALSKAVEYDRQCLDILEDNLDDAVVKIELKIGQKLKSRYSPGFGDFSLEYQNTILDILNAKTTLGITLTKDNYMIPSKSITAIIGVENV
jgi:hypothetical protein